MVITVSYTHLDVYKRQGYDGARIVGALLPQYHKNLRHIKINGNNIDAQGFECILSGLRACIYLKSI